MRSLKVFPLKIWISRIHLSLKIFLVSIKINSSSNSKLCTVCPQFQSFQILVLLKISTGKCITNWWSHILAALFCKSQIQPYLIKGNMLPKKQSIIISIIFISIIINTITSIIISTTIPKQSRIFRKKFPVRLR